MHNKLYYDNRIFCIGFLTMSTQLMALMILICLKWLFGSVLTTGSSAVRYVTWQVIKPVCLSVTHRSTIII